MKFLVTWSFAPKNAKEVTERFKKWKPTDNLKFLFPFHTIIGANKGFAIVDAENTEVMQRNVLPWSDLMTFKIYPIMDSREAIALV